MARAGQDKRFSRQRRQVDLFFRGRRTFALRSMPSSVTRRPVNFFCQTPTRQKWRDTLRDLRDRRSVTYRPACLAREGFSKIRFDNRSAISWADSCRRAFRDNPRRRGAIEN